MFKEEWSLWEARAVHARERIAERVHGPEAPLQIAAWHVHGAPVPFESAVAQKFVPFAVGDPWGGLWDTTWFRFRGKIPEEWSGREVLVRVRLTDFNYEGFTAEGLLYRDGKPERAINANRAEIPLAAEAVGGETFEFHIEAAANGGSNAKGFLPGLCQPDYAGKPRYALAEARLVCVDREIEAYYFDFTVLVEAMEVLPEGGQRRREIGRALNYSLDHFDADDIFAARESLTDVLERRNGETVHTVSGVGHAHIDTAWLWPLRESIRKCARTFSSALRNMELYPEYVFACSQPQHYAWMKVHYPEIWEGIRAAVARGQWEPVGAMWVEPDSNFPSAEALIRQILHGKRFFLREFGVEIRDAWLPDVFGFSAALPQILRLAGVQFLMTQKLSWNEFNRFPHHTFWWEGIDGSRVFAHFPPADTYNADTGPRQLAKTSAQFQEHGSLTRSLLPFGYGDGGGGPSMEMLEKARRLRDFEGLPRLELEKASAFFAKAADEADDLPVWRGELYLELHRGTLTSQARAKWNNRRAECLLRDAEFWDCAAMLANPSAPQSVANPPRAVYDTSGLDGGPAACPHQAALERAWKLTLLNQFHDILPGSSIHWVYEDNERDHAVIRELVDSVRSSAQGILAAELNTGDIREPALVVNPLGFDRAEVAEFPDGRAAWIEAPACGYRVLDSKAPGEFSGQPVRVEETKEGIVLENGLTRIVLSRDGCLTSLRDLLRDREALEPGLMGNVFHLHEDRPWRYDAWELDLFSRDNFAVLGRASGVRVLEKGPLRAAVELVYSFGKSRLTQRVLLRAGSGRVDFSTTVDWQERHKCLRVTFPANVLSGKATYDIGSGHIERPNHANTSWDRAQFEVCAHTWADLSEYGFGVALLNNGKYGYGVSGNTLSLTLLRAPESPDPLADRGTHHFTYSLLCHGGDFRAGRVIEEAAALNAPLTVRAVPPSQGALPPAHSFLRCDVPCLQMDAWKRAEDDDGLIVRLHEAHGSRGRGRLTLGFSAKRVSRTDLLERNQESLPPGREIAFDFTPFQILTFKLEGVQWHQPSTWV